MSAAGVGAVLGALQFAARTEYKGLAKWIASTCIICAICLLIFSFSTSFWVCAVMLFIVGFAATSQMAATNTIIQQHVPDEMRSRLMAVYATTFMGVQPIGALLAGVVAKHLGAPHTLLIFGLTVLVGCSIFIGLVVSKMNAERAAPAAAS